MSKRAETERAGQLHWSVGLIVIGVVIVGAIAALKLTAPDQLPGQRASVVANEPSKVEALTPDEAYQKDVVTFKHGPAPVASSIDGLAPQVSEWFRTNLRDPKSLEVVVTTGIDANIVAGGWVQIVTYRAKNGFGGYNKSTRKFVISKGKVVDTVDSDD